MSQEFGGPWTDDKLKRVREYLVAYRTIFAKNPRAKYFGTWYVDAFAGSGSRTHSPVAPRDVLFADVYSDQDREAYKNGSARIALELQNPFDRYLFIDTSRQKLSQLKTSVVRDFPKLLSRCEFDSKDANKSLQRWCSERNWDKERAVVFLDPFGMQVDWRTIETLATTRAVDLWYLFPLGIGVARLLPHHGEIDEQWRGALTRVFGTSDWQKRFLQITSTADLFWRQ